jgi:hypothetical protein
MIKVQNKIFISFVFLLFIFLSSEYNDFEKLNLNPITIELSVENSLSSNIISERDSGGDDFFVDFFELRFRNIDCSIDIIPRLSLIPPHGQQSVWQPPQNKCI